MSDAPSISIVIRTLNEARHLPALLRGISEQRSIVDNELLANTEIVVVDSGSTDGTIEIAESHGCQLIHIPSKDFTFGLSLNFGCEAANGAVLVFVSGHCIPVDRYWLARLVAPLEEDSVDYVYGRQYGVEETRYSEGRIFRKYFPPESAIPQDGFYCNNANSAVKRTAWERLAFDEAITGLEDLEFARRLIREGGRIGYASQSGVFHIHNETWRQVWRRFEREAVALQFILPEVRFGLLDLVRCLASGVYGDFVSGVRDKTLLAVFTEIIMYRSVQYCATWFGARRNNSISEQTKLGYYYPDIKVKAILNENSSVVAHEGKQ